MVVAKLPQLSRGSGGRGGSDVGGRETGDLAVAASRDVVSGDRAKAGARSDATIQQYIGLTGGVQPRARHRAANQLSLGEREEVSRRMAAGESMRVVA